MKEVRKIDDFGCVYIPIEFRKTLNIQKGDSVTIFIGNNGKLIMERCKTREEKIKEWVKKVEAHMKINESRITFNQLKNITVCLYYNCFKNKYNIGLAICAPNDQYDSHFGQVLSFARAINYPIPDFIYEK